MGLTVARRPSSSTSPAPAGSTVVARSAVVAPAVVLVPALPPSTAPSPLPRRSTQPPTSSASMFGLVHGSAGQRAAGAVMLGVTGLVGLVAPSAHAQEISAAPRADAPIDLSLARAAAIVESRRDTMTATELAEARRELYSAYVDSTTRAADPALTRGEVRVERLLRDVERRMEVTAYDMAHPGSYTPLEGHPGYKTIPEGELLSLLRDAVADIPIGELPGGQALARAVRALPNAGHLDAEHMSYNELRRAVGHANAEALREYFRPFLERHRTEVALTGFAAVTAARAASPATARVLDRLIPRIELYDRTALDGRVRGEASLRYRGGRVLPDVDLTGSATHRVGPVDLRATATGTVAFGGDERVTGTLGAGARVTGDRGWVDLEGTVDHRNISTVRLSGVLDVPEDGLVARGALTGTFGDGVARGDARGRVELETSLDRRLDLGRGVTGSVGVYGAAGVDTDGRNEDLRAGLMLRLHW